MAESLVNINEILESHINILYQIKEKIGIIAYKTVGRTIENDVDEKIKSAVNKINIIVAEGKDIDTILTDVLGEI